MVHEREAFLKADQEGFDSPAIWAGPIHEPHLQRLPAAFGSKRETIKAVEGRSFISRRFSASGKATALMLGCAECSCLRPCVGTARTRLPLSPGAKGPDRSFRRRSATRSSRGSDRRSP